MKSILATATLALTLAFPAVSLAGPAERSEAVMNQLLDLVSAYKGLARDKALTAEGDLRLSAINDAKATIAAIAAELPDIERGESAAVDAETPEGMTFGTPEWVTHQAARDVAHFFKVQSVASLGELTEACHRNAGYRARLQDEGLIKGGVNAQCGTLHATDQRLAHGMWVGHSKQQQTESLRLAISDSLGMELAAR